MFPLFSPFGLFFLIFFCIGTHFAKAKENVWMITNSPWQTLVLPCKIVMVLHSSNFINATTLWSKPKCILLFSCDDAHARSSQPGVTGNNRSSWNNAFTQAMLQLYVLTSWQSQKSSMEPRSWLHIRETCCCCRKCRGGIRWTVLTRFFLLQMNSIWSEVSRALFGNNFIRQSVLLLRAPHNQQVSFDLKAGGRFSFVLKQHVGVITQCRFHCYLAPRKFSSKFCQTLKLSQFCILRRMYLLIKHLSFVLRILQTLKSCFRWGRQKISGVSGFIGFATLSLQEALTRERVLWFLLLTSGSIHFPDHQCEFFENYSAPVAPPHHALGMIFILRTEGAVQIGYVAVVVPVSPCKEKKRETHYSGHWLF